MGRDRWNVLEENLDTLQVHVEALIGLVTDLSTRVNVLEANHVHSV